MSISILYIIVLMLSLIEFAYMKMRILKKIRISPNLRMYVIHLKTLSKLLHYQKFYRLFYYV